MSLPFFNIEISCRAILFRKAFFRTSTSVRIIAISSSSLSISLLNTSPFLSLVEIEYLDQLQGFNSGINETRYFPFSFLITLIVHISQNVLCIKTF